MRLQETLKSKFSILFETTLMWKTFMMLYRMLISISPSPSKDKNFKAHCAFIDLVVTFI